MTNYIKKYDMLYRKTYNSYLYYILCCVILKFHDSIVGCFELRSITIWGILPSPKIENTVFMSNSVKYTLSNMPSFN